MTALPNHRPDRSAEMDAFLARVGWGSATRAMLAGDASFRRYERVTMGDRIAVLMDAPPPWEDVRPFLAVTRTLQHCQVSVPRILAADEGQGFLLLEDLGDVSFTRRLKADPQHELKLYTAAIDALVAIHTASMAEGEVIRHTLKPYDMATYLREASLFAEWLLPQIHGIEKARGLREEYRALWESVITDAQLQQSCLVHRDYHADNLLWLPQRSGHLRVGMIDYQDALWGDPAYDLASLLEDARRDVAETTVAECFARYATAIGEDAHDFAARYAVIAAQRNAKIIGIFVRLCVRDGKVHYLEYLPRVWAHFMGDIGHPALAPIRAFVDAQVPPEWRGSFKADATIGGIVVNA